MYGTLKRAPRSPAIIAHCLNCDKEFRTLPSYIKRGHGKYCSKECFLIYNKGKPHKKIKITRKKNTHRNVVYTYNYDTEFIKRNDELSSYFWGLFVSDGHFSKKKSICFGMIDKQIIYDLAQRIKFVGTIGCQKRILPQHDIYKISLCGPVAQEINKYGYSPGPKTRKEFIPDCITGENLRHFVRGLWDGDGMMHLRKNTKHPLRTGVCCANKDLLVDLHTRLKSLNIVKGGTLFKQHANAIFYLCFGHMDSLLLCEWMYKDATIKLNRKYDEYIKGNAAGKIIAQKDNLCSFPGCKHPCIAKNMCDYHYHIPISRASYLRNKDVIRERRRLNKDHVNYLARLRYAKRYEELRA